MAIVKSVHSWHLNSNCANEGAPGFPRNEPIACSTLFRHSSHVTSLPGLWNQSSSPMPLKDCTDVQRVSS